KLHNYPFEFFVAGIVTPIPALWKTHQRCDLRLEAQTLQTVAVVGTLRYINAPLASAAGVDVRTTFRRSGELAPRRDRSAPVLVQQAANVEHQWQAAQVRVQGESAGLLGRRATPGAALLVERRRRNAVDVRIEARHGTLHPLQLGAPGARQRGETADAAI